MLAARRLGRFRSDERGSYYRQQQRRSDGGRASDHHDGEFEGEETKITVFIEKNCERTRKMKLYEADFDVTHYWDSPPRHRRKSSQQMFATRFWAMIVISPCFRNQELSLLWLPVVPPMKFQKQNSNKRQIPDRHHVYQASILLQRSIQERGTFLALFHLYETLSFLIPIRRPFSGARALGIVETDDGLQLKMILSIPGNFNTFEEPILATYTQSTKLTLQAPTFTP